MHNNSLYIMTFSHFHLTSLNFLRVRHGSTIPHATRPFFWKKVTKLHWADKNYSKYFVRRKLLTQKKFSNKISTSTHLSTFRDPVRYEYHYKH